MPARNLVNLSAVGREYAARTVLADVTLGVAAGERIGVVGANGAGKSTLLALIAGDELPDHGTVVRTGELTLALVGQRDPVPAPNSTVAELVIGGLAEHEWAGNANTRTVLDGLLGGVAITRFADGPHTRVATLSGGERRRVALASALIESPGLLALDEPTNHLDVEAISWLAGHLSRRRGALLVVTHDRWFLDAVCTATWEVEDAAVHRYEGGYAAYVLARAERERLERSREEKRRQLVRKELAWLRRGPPARTSKPRFRIEAANALIAAEPPARDSAELLRFAHSRLGNKVLEAEAVSFSFPEDGPRPLIDRLTWRLGPGERIALVGANGSGKTTLLRLLAGELEPTAGHVERGETVRLAHLSQDAAELPGQLTVLQAVQRVRQRAVLAGGREITAGRLIERLGFRGERARTRVDDLSGGERRRLSLARLLIDEPNVLLLDEPTNDLDIETLRALEDLLDDWPGTLVAVSHDRYFVERVCDNVFSLDVLGGIRHLPGGIDQYLGERVAPGSGPVGPEPGRSAPEAAARVPKPGAQLRAAQKRVRAIERELERSQTRERQLQELMAAHATDHLRLRELDDELQALRDGRETLEAEWLELAEALEP